MIGLAVFGPFPFKRFNFWSEDVPAAIEHARDCRVDFRLQLPVGCAKIEEGNFHLTPLFTATMKSS